MTRATMPTLPEGDDEHAACGVCGADPGWTCRHRPACDAIVELRERVRKLEEKMAAKESI